MFAQSERMAVEGSIQLDGAGVPAATVIRALRSDGTVARTITPYPMNPSRFGVRFSASDGFQVGEPISFRVVLSKRDSFPARIAGEALRYLPTPPPDIAVNRVLLFRNHLPDVRRWIPDTTIREQEFFRFKITAQDVDSDTLIYRFVTAPGGAWIDSRNGFVTWTPAFDQAGEHEVVFGVSDGREETFSRASKITVLNVNRPPRLTSVPGDRTVAEGELTVIQVEALEEDGDSLRFFLREKDHKALLFSTNGVFNWRPGYDAAGTYEFVAIVSDGEAADSSRPFSMKVMNTNRVPVFASVLHDTIAAEGEPWSHDFRATDPDGDVLEYRIELAPEGIQIDAAGLLTWTPAYDQAGSYVVIVSASDPEGSAEAVMRVSVLNRNRPPVFVRRPGLPVRSSPVAVEGSLIDLQWPAAVDPDVDDTLRYAIRLLGAGVDTTVSGIADTSISILSGGRFQVENTYRWMVSVTDGYTEVTYPDTFQFQVVPPRMFVRDEPVPNEVSFSFQLSNQGQSENPTVTIIRYSLAERSQVRLGVFTMLGERIATIEEGVRDAGRYTSSFDARSLSSGIYMFRLEAHPLEGVRLRDYVSTKKMVLVK